MTKEKTGRKILFEVVLTLSISFFLQLIMDPEFWRVSEWSGTDLFNFLHLWLTLLLAYYLFNVFMAKAVGEQGWASRFGWGLTMVGIFLAVLTIIILIDLAVYYFYYDVESLYEETTFYEFDLPIAVAVLIIGAVFFYQKYRREEAMPTPSSGEEMPPRLRVLRGSRIVLLPTQDLGVAVIDHGVVRIQTLAGVSYRSDDSLADLFNQLDVRTFFRINRQTIVHRKAIKEYSKMEYQKLRVELVDGLTMTTPLMVSKGTAPAFKKWLADSA